MSTIIPAQFIDVPVYRVFNAAGTAYTDFPRTTDGLVGANALAAKDGTVVTEASNRSCIADEQVID